MTNGGHLTQVRIDQFASEDNLKNFVNTLKKNSTLPKKKKKAPMKHCLNTFMQKK
jgi:hypothetical protein